MQLHRRACLRHAFVLRGCRARMSVSIAMQRRLHAWRVFQLAGPALCARPQQAHELTLKSLEAGFIRALRRRRAPGGQRVGLAFANPWHCGASKGRECTIRTRYGLVLPVGTVTRPQEGNCVRACSGSSRIAADQPLAQQRGACRDAARLARPARASSASTSAPTRLADRARLCEGVRRSMSGELLHVNSPRQTPGFATCRRRPLSTTSWRGAGGASELVDGQAEAAMCQAGSDIAEDDLRGRRCSRQPRRRRHRHRNTTLLASACAMPRLARSRESRAAAVPSLHRDLARVYR